MTKFASSSMDVEICQAFNKPSNLFLNRPLISVLEARGVPIQIFLDLQREQVTEIRNALKEIKMGAAVTEKSSLGSSFKLSSVWLNLLNLGFNFLGGVSEHNRYLDDKFTNRVLEYIMHHSLRELKYHCRIAVPGSWTLVGIADVHNSLCEGQIYACIQETSYDDPTYLEGIANLGAAVFRTGGALSLLLTPLFLAHLQGEIARHMHGRCGHRQAFGLVRHAR